jgi:uncharacterized protein YacL
MLLWVIRAFYVLTLAGTAWKITMDYAFTETLAPGGLKVLAFFSGILIIGGLPLLLDLIYPRKRIREISAVYFGLLIGSLLAFALCLALDPTLSLRLDAKGKAWFQLVASIMICYICVSILMQTKDDFRFIIPYVEFAREVRGRQPLILDTSVIIDGRIADIADTGLLDQTLIVPRFVLQELQAIADSSDRLRRNRGRRGLDVIDRLQNCRKVQLETPEVDQVSQRREEVDTQLILLARQANGKLVTNDVNLAKLAKIHDLETININAISAAAKPPVLHGEHLTVRLIRDGEEPGQGVGYLEDGTMVVAEMGKNFVGHEVNLVVTSVLQTNAGRMVFGRIDSKNPEPAKVPSGRS